MKSKQRLIIGSLVLVLLSLAAIFLFINRGYTVTLSDQSLIPNKTIINEEKVIGVENEEETPAEVCTTYSMEWAPGDKESILMDPIPNIYPGNVLSAKSLEDGTYIAIGDSSIRKPFTISIDQLNTTIAQEKVEEASLSNLRKAIKRIVNSPQVGTGTPNAVTTVKEITSSKQLEIYLKGSYSGGGTKVSASFNNLNTISRRYFLIDITQIYYSISTDDITPKGFFTRKPDNIDGKIPVYVQTVNYGRRIWIIYETSSKSSLTEAALDAQFSFFTGEVKTNNKILDQEEENNVTMKTIFVGGDLEAIKYAPTSVTDVKNIARIIQTGLKYSKNARGSALSYRLKNCYDKGDFDIVYAGKYTVRKCVAKETKDTTILANTLPNFSYQCAEHTGVGDRNFNGDAKFSFSTTLTTEGNVIYITINAFWKEKDGDETEGKLDLIRKELIRLPTNYVIRSINSGVFGDVGLYKFAKKNDLTPLSASAPNSPFKTVYVRGDGTTDDDMAAGACRDNNHAGIIKIEFNDVKISYTVNKVKK